MAIMTKRRLVELGIHKTFNAYWKNPKAVIIQNQRKIGNLQNIKAFSEYLSGLITRQPLIGEYIQSLYNEGKDIMRLYRFFYTSKHPDFGTALKFACNKYQKSDNISAQTIAEHISFNEQLGGGSEDEDV